MWSSIPLAYAIDAPIISIGLDHGFKPQKGVVDYMTKKNMTSSIFYVTQNFNRSFFTNSTIFIFANA
jgi:hypothetical protein